MKKPREKGLAFYIDKLTNSIENTSTGEVFDTVITELSIIDNKQKENRLVF